MTKSKVKVLRARAYIRVSYVGKARQQSLLSDAMQLDEAKRYAEYLAFDFNEMSSKQCADLDVSGFRKPWRQRPGLMEHYRAAERGEFDVLIFYKISRLARNVKEALDMIGAFEKLGVAFHFVAERIDSTSGQGRFVRNVLLSAAEMQSEDTSEFLKASCERRAREGRLQGGATPAWIIRKSDGRFELIPEQVEAMQRLVELRLNGLGYVKIAQQLNLEGFRSVRGRYWTSGMTFKYLQPTWIRTMAGVGFFGRNNSEPIEIPDAYPRILESEMIERLLTIQKLYSEDYGRKPVAGLDWMISKRRKHGRYSASSIHLLSSILFCPYCQARLVASERTDDSHRAGPFNYACPYAVTRKEDHQRGLQSVAAHALEDAVLRVLRGALSMPPDSLAVLRRQEPKRTLETIQDKIDQLVTLHLDGKIGEDDFKRVYADLTDARQRELENSQETSLDLARRQVESLNAKAELTRAELRQMVLLMIERVEAPIVVAGQTIRSGHSSLRRFARVLLKFPRADGQVHFLSPIYNSRYRGEREYWPEVEFSSSSDSIITV